MPETTIAQNHSHVLTVLQEDIDAGKPKDYDIQGGANHSHTVALTAEDFAALGEGDEVEKVASGMLRHVHTVLITADE
jgi:hypothetical protein